MSSFAKYSSNISTVSKGGIGSSSLRKTGKICWRGSRLWLSKKRTINRAPRPSRYSLISLSKDPKINRDSRACLTLCTRGSCYQGRHSKKLYNIVGQLSRLLQKTSMMTCSCLSSFWLVENLNREKLALGQTKRWRASRRIRSMKTMELLSLTKLTHIPPFNTSTF